MRDAVDQDQQQQQYLAYSAVGAFSLILWEWAISLADEVELVWRGTKFAPTKWAYLLLRYYTLFVLFCSQDSAVGTGACHKWGLCRPPHCTGWYAFVVGSLQVIMALQQFLMASRVFALYSGTRRVGLILGALFLLEHAVMATSTGLSLPGIIFNSTCNAISIPPAILGIGLPPILFDLLLLVMTVYKTVNTSPNWRRTPLLWLLLRDGTWAFLVVFGVLVLNGMCVVFFHSALASIGWPWQHAVSSFAACRTVLHMHRDAGRRTLGSSSRSDSFASGLGVSRWTLDSHIPGIEMDDLEQ